MISPRFRDEDEERDWIAETDQDADFNRREANEDWRRDHGLEDDE